MSKVIKTNEGANIREILNQRESTYGEFENNARIHNNLMCCLMSPSETIPSVQFSALMHITGKLARAVSGDIDYIDNWQDIAGYAQLVVDHLQKQQEQGELLLDEDDETFEKNDTSFLRNFKSK